MIDCAPYSPGKILKIYECSNFFKILFGVWNLFLPPPPFWRFKTFWTSFKFSSTPPPPPHTHTKVLIKLYKSWTSKAPSCTWHACRKMSGCWTFKPCTVTKLIPNLKVNRFRKGVKILHTGSWMTSTKSNQKHSYRKQHSAYTINRGHDQKFDKTRARLDINHETFKLPESVIFKLLWYKKELSTLGFYVKLGLVFSFSFFFFHAVFPFVT